MHCRAHFLTAYDLKKIDDASYGFWITRYVRNCRKFAPNKEKKLTTLLLNHFVLDRKWLDLVKVVSLPACAILQVTQCFKISSHDFSNVI